MEYQFTLPQPQIKSYIRITLLIAFLNAVCFIFYFLKAPTTTFKMIAAVGLLLSVALVFIMKANKANQPLKFKPIVGLMYAQALCWLLFQHYLLLFLLMVTATICYYALRPVTISIKASGINYPSFPPKFYEWTEVTQIILKDAVLTIDLKNNRFLQFLIPENSLATINEGNFNEYCAHQKQEALQTTKQN